MKEGSLVKTECCFEYLRRVYNLPYPKKGQILTVCHIEPHHNRHCHKKGIVLLHFEELPTLPGISDKTIYDEYNFTELLPPIDLEEALKDENLAYIG